ncbi:hypothetical protein BGLA2_2100034 [Burkholderia gladioli]|nr:hypothetical protein BGLA2_2100034 [Burkholderia gladioli]
MTSIRIFEACLPLYSLPVLTQTY